MNARFLPALFLLTACARPQPDAPSAHANLADTGIVPSWLDRSVDPCDDYFAYACGGFLASSIIAPDRSSVSAISQVEDETEVFLRGVLEAAEKEPESVLGDYYAACMNQAQRDALGQKPLEAMLTLVKNARDLDSTTRVIGDLHVMGVDAFFWLGPSQDYADATQVIASLDQAGLGLPERKYYLEDSGNLKSVRDAYQQHVARSFVLLGLDAEAAARAARDVLEVETSLARLHQDQVARRDPHAIYHRIDRKGLLEVAPNFDWARYFARQGLGDVQAITVHDPAYYGALTALIEREPAQAIQSYLTYQVLATYGGELSTAFVDEAFRLEQILSGAEEVAPLVRRCVLRVDQDLGELLAQPYVAARFSGDAKARAIELTKAVFATMHEQLGKLPWMDDVTRSAAREKLAHMSYLIGYPDSYRKYDFAVSRELHLSNVVAASQFERRRQLAKIGKPVDAKDWAMTPPTVNAYYDGTLNQLVLPAGLLQPPFFGRTFHPAVNFGATGGGTVGHEMTHGFDDEGSQFDAHGNLRDWWSPETARDFAAATECVQNQYGSYEVVPGVHLDGKLTSGENIADIGGVKLAYQAYRSYRERAVPKPEPVVEGITDDQLYFLGYAQSWCSKSTPESLETRAHSDPHSPARFRVNGVMVNQPGFRAAYQCKEGAKMAPKTMCAIW